MDAFDWQEALSAWADPADHRVTHTVLEDRLTACASCWGVIEECGADDICASCYREIGGGS